MADYFKKRIVFFARFLILAERAFIFRFLNLCQIKLVGCINTWSVPQQIIVRYVFKKQAELDDFCMRLDHFVPRDLDVQIVICLREGLEYKGLYKSVSLISCLPRIFNKKDCWYLYPKVGLHVFKLFSYVCNIRNSIIVDPWFYFYTEVENWVLLSNVLTGSQIKEELRKISASNIAVLQKKVNRDTIGVCVLTGPSISKLGVDINLPDDRLVVTCNTIVNNAEVIKRLKPDIYAIVDFVFVATPEKYNESFYINFRNMITEYGSYILLSDVFAPLFARIFPEFQDKIICTTFNSSCKWEIMLDEILYVNGMGSTVLTNAMLPMLSVLTKTINVAGADGYSPAAARTELVEHLEQNAYKKMQNSLVSLHPSIMRDTRLKKKSKGYYRSLESIVLSLENSGNIIINLTKSFIPCLAARTVDDAYIYDYTNDESI